jgi:hypothetical protein
MLSAVPVPFEPSCITFTMENLNVTDYTNDTTASGVPIPNPSVTDLLVVNRTVYQPWLGWLEGNWRRLYVDPDDTA